MLAQALRDSRGRACGGEVPRQLETEHPWRSTHPCCSRDGSKMSDGDGCGDVSVTSGHLTCEGGWRFCPLSLCSHRNFSIARRRKKSKKLGTKRKENDQKMPYISGRNAAFISFLGRRETLVGTFFARLSSCSTPTFASHTDLTIFHLNLSLFDNTRQPTTQAR